MADEIKEPTITEKYTAKLQELNANTQQDITQAFREHRETWNNILAYEQARWRWATEEQQYGPDTSVAGHGLHAVPKAPETALETSQAVQAAIQGTAVARETREAWLLAEGGTTRPQLIHRAAYDVQHPAQDALHEVRQESYVAQEREQQAANEAAWERVQADRPEALSPGERLVAYYTDLKAHLREQEQLGLPLDASERRQEVLAFAAQWQAQHGPVHDDAHTVQRDYAAVQERVAAARESVVEPARGQSREEERGY